MKGYLQPEVTAWCGLCGNWHRESGKPAAVAKKIRAQGWKLTRKWGWICPMLHQTEEATP